MHSKKGKYAEPYKMTIFFSPSHCTNRRRLSGSLQCLRVKASLRGGDDEMITTGGIPLSCDFGQLVDGTSTSISSIRPLGIRMIRWLLGWFHLRGHGVVCECPVYAEPRRKTWLLRITEHARAVAAAPIPRGSGDFSRDACWTDYGFQIACMLSVA